MFAELHAVLSKIIEYVSKAFSFVTVIIGSTLSFLGYIMFPEQAYFTAAIAVGIGIVMDIISKYVAISANNGGFVRAFNEGKIFSKTLWEGTKVKLIAYLSISIMVGASHRLNTLPETIPSVSKFMATVVYTVLFLRDFQSMLENFKDAGVDVDWLLAWSRTKEKEIMKKEGIKEEVKENGTKD